MAEVVRLHGDEASIRLALQSDRRLLSDALIAYLTTLPDFTVVGRVADPDNVVSLCELRRPDVLLVDAEVDFGSALRTSQLLHDRFPEVRVVVVYESLSTQQLSDMHKLGVSALVPAAHGLEALLIQLRRRQPETRRYLPPRTGLSDREMEIIQLLGSGHTVPEIAALLGIAVETVENHKRRMYAKLEVASACHAVARAAALGLMAGPSAPLPPASRRVDGDRSGVVVVSGAAGPGIERVARVLLRNQISFQRDHAPVSGKSHWEGWHRGLVTVVLVDPGAGAWTDEAVRGRPVVVVSSRTGEQATLARSLATKVDAVLPVEQVDTQLVPALSRAAQRHLLRATGFTGPASGSVEFTARECDILASIALGHTVRQTAQSLGIAPKTVENTQARLFGKLGVHNRAGALGVAYALGLLPPGGPGSLDAASN